MRDLKDMKYGVSFGFSFTFEITRIPFCDFIAAHPGLRGNYNTLAHCRLPATTQPLRDIGGETDHMSISAGVLSMKLSDTEV